jgi:hypothetical protein
MGIPLNAICKGSRRDFAHLPDKFLVRGISQGHPLSTTCAAPLAVPTFELLKPLGQQILEALGNLSTFAALGGQVCNFLTQCVIRLAEIHWEALHLPWEAAPTVSFRWHEEVYRG